MRSFLRSTKRSALADTSSRIASRSGWSGLAATTGAGAGAGTGVATVGAGAGATVGAATSLKVGGGKSGGSGRLIAADGVEPVVSPLSATSAADGGGTLAGSGIGTSASIAGWLWASAGVAADSPRISATAVPVKMRSKARLGMQQILEIPVRRTQHDPNSARPGKAALNPHPDAEVTLKF